MTCARSVTPAFVLLALLTVPCSSRSDPFSHMSKPRHEGAALAVPGSGLLSPGQPRLFLGFEVGEERRYVLGPPERLYAGESGSWSILLRHLLGDPPDGIFELTHEWQRGADEFDPPLGTVTQTSSKGELRTNRYGFPLELEFETKRHLSGFGDDHYTIRFRYANGRYLKHASMEDKTHRLTVEIPSHDGLDLPAPSGLYAFAPTSLDCSIPLPPSLRGAAAVPRQLPTAGSTASPPPPSPPLKFVDNAFCEESLFANPALLSLMLPELWERATGEHEFLLLTPTGPFGLPGFIVGGQAGGMIARAGGGSNTARGMRPQSNADVRTLRYLDRVEIAVGSRTRGAWLFDEMGEFEAIYVDDDDVVLRVDIVEGGNQQLGVIGPGGALMNFDPTQRRARDLFIRLLFPSEY